MYVLGICDGKNAASAALIADGRVYAALQEAKLEDRVQYIQPGNFPFKSIAECCRIVGIGKDHLHRFVHYSAGETIAADYADCADWGWTDHLVSQGAWAFYASPFDRA